MFYALWVWLLCYVDVRHSDVSIHQTNHRKRQDDGSTWSGVSKLYFHLLYKILTTHILINGVPNDLATTRLSKILNQARRRKSPMLMTRSTTTSTLTFSWCTMPSVGELVDFIYSLYFGRRKSSLTYFGLGPVSIEHITVNRRLTIFN